MDVQAASSASSASSAATKQTGTSSISKDDFLKILIAQLQNQDPLNPTDPNQFVTELAQLTSNETLQNIQGDLDNMAGATQMGQWTSTIGDFMQVSDSNLSQGDRVVVSPPSGDYKQITLTLQSRVDGSTKQVTFNPGDSLTYTDSDSAPYSVVGASATDSSGQTTACGTTVYRQIAGVQAGSAGTVLVAGDGTTYPTANVTQITK